MYSEKVKAQLTKIVKNWTGKEGSLRSLKTHDLILALDQARCDLANGFEIDPVVPAILQNLLSKRLLDLATKKEHHLKFSLGEALQVYQLVRPKVAYNLNMLFVYTSHGALGVGYRPEQGCWDHGHYNMSQESAEKYIYETYGMAVPLLKEEK